MEEKVFTLAPIENFVTDEETIELGNGLIIKKFSAEELAIFKDFVKIMDTFSRVDPFGFHYAQQADIEQSGTLIDKAIFCLRLFKEGNIGVKSIATFSFSGDKIIGRSGIYHETRKFSDTEKYNLTKPEIKEFNKLREIYYATKVSDNGFWSLAKNRFESSYGNRRLDDKLIDFTVGLEALFSEGPGDLRYKLSSRIARLLMKNKDAREKTSIAVKKIYDFRSKIVHGEASKDPDFKANIGRAENYLRDSLKRFLELIGKYGENKDELLKIIDFEM